MGKQLGDESSATRNGQLLTNASKELLKVKTGVPFAFPCNLQKTSTVPNPRYYKFKILDAC